MTAEEERRIAEFVTGNEWSIQGEPGHEEIFMADPLDDPDQNDMWNPSLTGSDREKAQALDVLLAAMHMDTSVDIFVLNFPNHTRYSFKVMGKQYDSTDDRSSVLNAAKLAILAYLAPVGSNGS